MRYSNHIIRFDKYALIIILAISILLPTYFTILQKLGDFNHSHSNVYDWLMYNVSMTFVAAFFIHLANVKALHLLECKYPWKSKPWERLCLEIPLVFAYTITIMTLVEFAFYPFHNALSDKEHFAASLFRGIVYADVLNLMIVTVYEGVYLFNQWKKALIETEKLQKEHILSQYETLRTQINPHFLFNSLNTLIGIVRKDPEQAIAFIQEFAKVYRSVLDYKDNLVITLDDELCLVNSFIFLQKMRFQENLKVNIEINANRLKYFIPPFSIQLLIENAIKHNIVSEKRPLNISVKVDDMFLVVKNNLQKRLDEINSTGIGLQNLNARYEMISEVKPEFYIENQVYIAKIPLVEAD